MAGQAWTLTRSSRSFKAGSFECGWFSASGRKLNMVENDGRNHFRPLKTGSNDVLLLNRPRKGPSHRVCRSSYDRCIQDHSPISAGSGHDYPLAGRPFNRRRVSSALSNTLDHRVISLRR